MHLDIEQVQRALHGELGSSAEAVRKHLESCAECRSQLREAESEEEWVLEQLRCLDHAPPAVSAATLVRRPNRGPARIRWAAGIVLALAAAGIAYAAPGSPLPRVLERILSAVSRAPERPAENGRAGRPTSQSGIAVVPGAHLSIAFPANRFEDTALVTVTDGDEVVVRAQGGTARFTSDNDLLEVGPEGARMTFEILIPRTAPSVEIRSGDQPLWSKTQSRIETGVRPSREGHYLLPLSGTPP